MRNRYLALGLMLSLTVGLIYVGIAVVTYVIQRMTVVDFSIKVIGNSISFHPALYLEPFYVVFVVGFLTSVGYLFGLMLIVQHVYPILKNYEEIKT